MFTQDCEWIFRAYYWIDLVYSSNCGMVRSLTLREQADCCCRQSGAEGRGAMPPVPLGIDMGKSEGSLSGLGENGRAGPG